MRMHYRLLFLVVCAILLASTIAIIFGGVDPVIAVSMSFMDIIGAAFSPYRNFVLPTGPYILLGQLIGIIGYIIITIILTTFFYRLLRNIDIKAGISKRKAAVMSKHIVLNTINSFSLELARNLKQRNIKFIMIDRDKRRVDSAIDSGFVAVQTDISMGESEDHAYIEDARILVLLGNDDVENVLITIEARKVNPALRILSRIKREEDMERVLDSGVAYAIMPENAVGDEIGEFLLKAI